MQPPHTVKRTKEYGLTVTGGTFIPHPAYSPDLAPSDFHLFGPLKRHLGGKKFEDEDELTGEVRDWFSSLTQTFSHRVYTRFSHGGKNTSFYTWTT
ncbi:transposase [Plakobranchus ocellatus]|uniref:Transposase n=1 Tax=Plakobranchus ocellatus TaxID=259542 RepID=A0AAV3ZF70_9GAST|nr:transposase [Plakobranchus ocellatus]